jgi:hypothetical protein
MNVKILMGEPVSIDDAALRKRLSGAGLTIDRVLPRIAVITGSIDPANLSSLRAIPGVKQVEEEGFIRLIE